MQATPFFHRDGERFLPSEYAPGYWSPNLLSGRVVVGLLGAELERRHGAADWQPARLTVDMLRQPGLEPLEVTTRVVRDGKRLRLAEADFVSGGEPLARASCQFLRRTANTPGDYWSPPAWDAPPPAEVPATPEARQRWERRPIPETADAPGRKRIWLREVRELIGGVPLTPFARVALAADFTNPLTNSGSGGLGYINSDVTLYLHRLPAGEFIGLETVDHAAAAGVAVGQARVHDEAGPIGAAVVAGVAQSRRA
jgi:hypothetical protein